MKKLLIIILIILGISLYFPSVRGEYRSFERGDAITYNSDLVIASVVSDGFELFVYDQEEDVERYALVPQKEYFFYFEKINDLLLCIEDEKLFLYVAGNNHLYKYDITRFDAPQLVLRKSFNLKTKFLAIDKNAKDIYTTEKGSLKIWDKNLNMLTEHTFSLSATNFKIANEENLVFGTSGSDLFIYSANARKLISKTKVFLKSDSLKSFFVDDRNGLVYLADDEALRVIDFNGDIVAERKHMSVVGYDVFYVDGGIFFTDGIGIVKLDENSLKPIAWLHTETVNSGNGWAGDLKYSSEKKLFVIFNNSEILLLNHELELLEAIELEREVLVDLGEENEDDREVLDFEETVNDEGDVIAEVDLEDGDYEEEEEERIEGLYLENYDLSAGDYIKVISHNFQSGENIFVRFLDKEYEFIAGDDGTLIVDFQIPPAVPGHYELIASGVSSGLEQRLSIYID